CGYRLDLLGGEAVEKPVHHFAPRPEIVAFRASRFRKPRHAALEPMAVHIAKAWDCDGMPLILRARLNAGLNARNPAVRNLDANVLRPAYRQQRSFEPERHGQFPCYKPYA